MRRTTLIGISILSVFLLCSLSYQHIADEPIIERKLDVIYTESDDCDCISNDKNWVPPFLCLSLWLQLFILGLLLVKFDDEFPLWPRWNARALGLIEVFFELDCDELIKS